MKKRQTFYKSRKWEQFVKGLRIMRAAPDGSVICEYCGKPIVKAYDCIGHHVTELTEENVDDVSVSLNPENVQLVHFRCHNAIHKRFDGGGKKEQRVYIVYGSPCAGKTTWVRENAERGDLILDLDRLWAAVRAECCGTYEKPNELKGIIFGMRDDLTEMIACRRGNWHHAYIIGGYPLEAERERLADRVGADRVIFIDTPQEVCMERALHKGADWPGYVSDWFGKAGR